MRNIPEDRAPLPDPSPWDFYNFLEAEETSPPDKKSHFWLSLLSVEMETRISEDDIRIRQDGGRPSEEGSGLTCYITFRESWVTWMRLVSAFPLRLSPNFSRILNVRWDRGV